MIGLISYTYQCATPQTVTNYAGRIERQCIGFPGCVGITPIASSGASVGRSDADGEVDNVEDDAKSSSNDEHCAEYS